MRIRAQAALGLLVLIALPYSARSAPPAAWNVAWEPKQPVNGSAVLFRVTPPAALASLHGSWSGHEISFRFDPQCNCWYAIAGISLDAKAGQYTLQLQGISQDAASSSFTSQVTVAQKRYPTTSISVAPEYVKPPLAVLTRIEEEEALKKQVFAQIAPESSWADRFLPPVESDITAAFGSSRTYNGVKKSSHLGLDFRAAVGTTVRAANRGTVILARNLYYEGNCVFIDHGQGLLTLYFHLSEIKVKEGDTIESGQVVGLSGGTGRVTGPHLHFAVRWQGVYVDPETLLSLHPPQPAGSRTRPGGTL